MAYKIYYEDGQRIKSWELARDSGIPQKGVSYSSNPLVPRRGIVAIIQDDDTAGWTILTGHDYYIWWNNQWRGCNLHQLIDYLIELSLLQIEARGLRVHANGKWQYVDLAQFKFFLDKSGIVLTGRITSGKMQEDILQEAAYDAEFPNKSKWFLNEPSIALRAPGVARHYEEDKRL